jgi:thioredoxin-like negative regulator of GroEL
MMAERILFSLLLIAVGTAVYLLVKCLHVRAAQRAAATAVTGHPTILYFRSDNCAVCPAQSRYLEQLHGTWNGRVQIQPINAETEPETAGKYGVFTLPTTILLDAAGKVREINYGLTNTQKLDQQLATFA